MTTTPNERPAQGLRAGDAKTAPPPSAGAKKLGGVAGWVDDRLGPAKGVNYLMKKVFQR